MPGIHEYVNYSTDGICRIEDIRPMTFDGAGGEKEYYILKPVGQDRANIFVPADNPRLTGRMRPILSREEIDRLILSVKDRRLEWLPDRKERTEQFRQILAGRDERQLLLLISCLYLRSQESERGISAAEARLLKKAEDVIRQEFAFSLGISPEEIGRYIQARLGMETAAGA